MFTNIEIGSKLALLSYTGVRLSDVTVKSFSDTYIYTISKANKMLIFDRHTGVQVNHNNPKFANKITQMEDAPDMITRPDLTAAPVAPRKVEIDFEKKVKVEPAPTSAKHAKHDIIQTCIKSDIPVYLVGDAGTGKNHTLQAIAEDLEMSFYFTNSVQQEYKITGFKDAGGVYHETEFYKAFTQGGLFFLDELDASIPEVLVLLNAAIANRYFEFPNGKVNAHPDFRVVAAGNTVGSGADEMYTGRLVLDSATLDRFVTIEFDYDRNVELMLAKGNVDLVNFTRSLREFCKTNGIRATFSYRMIQNVVKLEAAGIPLKEIIRIAVVKGLDKDTIKMLKVTNSGKYYYGLRELQVA